MNYQQATQSQAQKQKHISKVDVKPQGGNHHHHHHQKPAPGRISQKINDNTKQIERNSSSSKRTKSQEEGGKELIFPEQQQDIFANLKQVNAEEQVNAEQVSAEAEESVNANAEQVSAEESEQVSKKEKEQENEHQQEHQQDKKKEQEDQQPAAGNQEKSYENSSQNQSGENSSQNQSQYPENQSLELVDNSQQQNQQYPENHSQNYSQQQHENQFHEKESQNQQTNTSLLIQNNAAAAAAAAQDSTSQNIISSIQISSIQIESRNKSKDNSSDNSDNSENSSSSYQKTYQKTYQKNDRNSSSRSPRNKSKDDNSQSDRIRSPRNKSKDNSDNRSSYYQKNDRNSSSSSRSPRNKKEEKKSFYEQTDHSKKSQTDHSIKFENKSEKKSQTDHSKNSEQTTIFLVNTNMFEVSPNDILEVEEKDEEIHTKSKINEIVQKLNDEMHSSLARFNNRINTSIHHHNSKKNAALALLTDESTNSSFSFSQQTSVLQQQQQQPKQLPDPEAVKQYTKQRINMVKEYEELEINKLTTFYNEYTEILLKECSIYNLSTDYFLYALELHQHPHLDEKEERQAAQATLSKLLVNFHNQNHFTTFKKSYDYAICPILSKLSSSLKQFKENYKQLFTDNLVENLLDSHLLTHEDLELIANRLSVPFQKISKINSTSNHANSLLLRCMEQLISKNFLTSPVVRVNSYDNDDENQLYHHHVTTDIDYQNHFIQVQQQPPSFQSKNMFRLFSKCLSVVMTNKKYFQIFNQRQLENYLEDLQNIGGLRNPNMLSKILKEGAYPLSNENTNAFVKTNATIISDYNKLHFLKLDVHSSEMQLNVLKLFKYIYIQLSRFEYNAEQRYLIELILTSNKNSWQKYFNSSHQPSDCHLFTHIVTEIVNGNTSLAKFMSTLLNKRIHKKSRANACPLNIYLEYRMNAHLTLYNPSFNKRCNAIAFPVYKQYLSLFDNDFIDKHIYPITESVYVFYLLACQTGKEDFYPFYNVSDSIFSENIQQDKVKLQPYQLLNDADPTELANYGYSMHDLSAFSTAINIHRVESWICRKIWSHLGDPIKYPNTYTKSLMNVYALNKQMTEAMIYKSSIKFFGHARHKFYAFNYQQLRHKSEPTFARHIFTNKGGFYNFKIEENFVLNPSSKDDLMHFSKHIAINSKEKKTAISRLHRGQSKDIEFIKIYLNSHLKLAIEHSTSYCNQNLVSLNQLTYQKKEDLTSLFTKDLTETYYINNLIFTSIPTPIQFDILINPQRGGGGASLWTSISTIAFYNQSINFKEEVSQYDLSLIENSKKSESSQRSSYYSQRKYQGPKKGQGDHQVDQHQQQFITKMLYEEEEEEEEEQDE